jgi:carboxyl-terminal processing protease
MVEGEKFTTLDIRNMLRGQAGTMVRLVVRRPGVNELMTLELKREDIKIDNVRYSTLVHEDIGYVLLRGFTNGAGEEVKKAIQDLKKLNPNLKGLVLDLRDNPGGLLQEAINISSLFVGNQEKIVETRGRMDGSLKSYNASVPPIETQLPLVVLINSNSASASEIVSGVMQDLDRGVVLGTRSFGKGLVQTTVRLSYESQLKITTARYFTPSGRCIQAVDYAQRGEDGSVVRTPDSLQKNFYTRNGRLMHDAGGIEPDEVVEIEALREVTMQLLRENYIFNYATRFRNQHESLADPKTFALTDAQYKDFVTYAIDSGFKFKPLVMREIEELGNKLTKRDYFTSVETSYNDLVGKTQNAVDQDIWTHRTEIQQLLEEEIVSRYFYSEGRTQQQLGADPQLEAAVSLLRDLDRYSTYLKGSK